MIKLNCRGRIIKGDYSPRGKIIVEESRSGGSYYVYIWPNDGSKWSESDDDMVYDDWLENYYRLEEYFNDRNWEIEWEEKDKSTIKDK